MFARHRLTPNIPWPRAGPSICGRLIAFYIHVYSFTCLNAMTWKWNGYFRLSLAYYVGTKNTTTLEGNDGSQK